MAQYIISAGQAIAMSFSQLRKLATFFQYLPGVVQQQSGLLPYLRWVGHKIVDKGVLQTWVDHMTFTGRSLAADYVRSARYVEARREPPEPVAPTATKNVAILILPLGHPTTEYDQALQDCLGSIDATWQPVFALASKSVNVEATLTFTIFNSGDELHALLSDQPDVSHCLLITPEHRIDANLMMSISQNLVADEIQTFDVWIPDQRLYLKPGFSPELTYDPDYVLPLLLPINRLSVIDSAFQVAVSAMQDRTHPVRHVSLPVTRVRATNFEEMQACRLAYVDLCKSSWEDWAPSESNFPALYPKTSIAKKISVIVPTRDRLPILKACINSVLSCASGQDFEIIIVNNRSEEPDTLKWLEEIAGEQGAVRVMEADVDFNWSRLNNLAAQQANGEVLVFLNNDTEVISNDWLSRLSRLCVYPEIGFVGPLLLFPDQTIQHAGVVVGYGGYADHPYLHMPIEVPETNFVPPLQRRNCLALTGACLAVEKHKFDELGGFDERAGVVGDVLLCITAHHHGLRNVYTPDIRLFHHESQTRQRHLPLQDRQLIAAELMRLGQDPYFHPDLALWSRFPVVDYS